ncbi:26S proteasome regulatory subunit Rpn7 [Penicillium malachiteum]|uniref:COP9 signalosome complex subunit 1 n=1 Tax=Penicillium malachiteum TaxID=1324776 RepID=A0AAD6MUU2_9EURO|nr:26S proteasome regulatory subunit Rpn7 [Penicillium malachiteum]
MSSGRSSKPGQAKSRKTLGLFDPKTEDAPSGILGASLKPNPQVIGTPNFELETYISNYKGRSRFNRLFHIGTTSDVLAVDALKLAVAQALSETDVDQYLKAVQALARLAPKDPELAPNLGWVGKVRADMQAKTERLESELRGYKNNLIKESIRMGNEDLGNHFYATGDLPAASRAYWQMRDFCTTPTHVSSMYLKLINVSMDRNDWISTHAYVYRLRNALSKPEDMAKNTPRTVIALGLSQMHQGQYLEAANTFLSIDPTGVLEETFDEVISANDVAVYGGLCALASMTRDDLKRRVLDNKSFRNFLELEPHIRRAIKCFWEARYRPLLDILESYRVDYMLDVHLHKHIDTLYRQIRVKSIQQYLIPSSKTVLKDMIAIFSPELMGGEAKPFSLSSPFIVELIRLIENDLIDFRIDLVGGFLVRNQVDLRAQVQAEILQNVAEFNNAVRLRMLNMEIMDSPMAIEPVTAADRAYRRPNDPNLPDFQEGSNAYQGNPST